MICWRNPTPSCRCMQILILKSGSDPFFVIYFRKTYPKLTTVDARGASSFPMATGVLQRVRGRCKICRKRAQVSAKKLRVIGGDDFAHAAQTCASFCAEIARFSAERAHFCIGFARGAHAFDANSAENTRNLRASSPATMLQTWRKLSQQIFAEDRTLFVARASQRAHFCICFTRDAFAVDAKSAEILI